MNLIQRVQDMLLKPKETWPQIEGESATTASIFKEYVMILAAIGAIASFIGLSIIGVGGFGFSVRIPILAGLASMVLRYVMALVMVYVLALLIDALAPTFGGTKNPLAALKVAAYGMTAAFVGGIFGLIPMLGMLALLAGLYSIYLLYLGLPVLMKCPPDKAPAYTAVVVVAAIVAGVIFGSLSHCVTGGAMMAGGAAAGMAGMRGSDGPAVTIKTPGGEVSINTAKMEEMGKKMEAAAKQMEAAQAKGDGAAAGKAMGDIMGAVTGAAAGGAAPIAAQDLKALLPAMIGDLARESYEAQGGQGMGVGMSSAKATYVAGERRVQLSITDLGGMAGLAAMAGWAQVTSDRETQDETEKVFKQDKRMVREKARKDGSHAELTVVTENGVMVEANGDRVDLATLKKVVEGVGLAKIEAMKRAAKS